MFDTILFAVPKIILSIINAFTSKTDMYILPFDPGIYILLPEV